MLLNPNDLLLDNRNYRILPYLQTPIENQKDILKCIATSKEFDLQEMIDSILLNKWRSIGTRPVIIQENGKNIVIEGNRRIAACKVLLNNIQEYENIKIPNTISEEVLSSISKIEVDQALNRDSLLPFLSDRHIKPAKRWSTISKQYLSYDLFKSGKKIEEIADILQLDTSKITTALRGYYLLQYAFSLETWSDEEKEILRNPGLKVDRFLRLFNTQKAAEDVGLNWDVYFQPYSDKHPQEVFKEVISFLVRKSLIENPPAITTRTEWKDIYEREEFLPLKHLLNLQDPPKEDPTDDTSDDEPFPEMHSDSSSEKSADGETSGASQAASNSQENQSGNKGYAPAGSNFMAGITCRLDKQNPACNGIISIAHELYQLSTSPYSGYTKYPISSAILLRSFFEQLFCFHLKNVKLQDNTSKTYLDKIKESQRDPNKDPLLGTILDKINNWLDAGDTRIFKNINHRQFYEFAFRERSPHKQLLDMLVHHTEYVLITPLGLDAMAKQGMLALANGLMALYHT